MIKYRYALDSSDKLVDIKTFVRKELNNNEKYYSLDFKQELIPRLGKIKVKHFFLKPNTKHKGTKETYLHALGKKVFKDEYLTCLKNATPFFITYKTQKICNRFSSNFNPLCKFLGDKSTYDVTKFFIEIHEEKRDGNFIPDLLLLNPITRDRIYIEIVVTHTSSLSKQNSGNLIIEIILKQEKDVQSIIKLKTGESLNNILFYNFKIKPTLCTSCKSLNANYYFFNVSQNGKCTLKVSDEKEIEDSRKCFLDSFWHTILPIDFNNLDSSSHINSTFKSFVALAHRETGRVRDCYLCKYHANSSSANYLFCKLLDNQCSSNEAVNCKYYKIQQELTDIIMPFQITEI